MLSTTLNFGLKEQTGQLLATIAILVIGGVAVFLYKWRQSVDIASQMRSSGLGFAGMNWQTS
jgi:hypothetical protein